MSIVNTRWTMHIWFLITVPRFAFVMLSWIVNSKCIYETNTVPSLDYLLNWIKSTVDCRRNLYSSAVFMVLYKNCNLVFPLEYILMHFFFILPLWWTISEINHRWNRTFMTPSTLLANIRLSNFLFLHYTDASFPLLDHFHLLLGDIWAFQLLFTHWTHFSWDAT